MAQDKITYDSPTGNLYQQPVEGQTLTVQTPGEIEAESYYIASRNLKNYNEIPIEKTSVYLNFIARKKLVYDSKIKRIKNTDFEYFADFATTDGDFAEVEPVLDGQIFRCIGEGLRTPRNYTYYIMENGVSKRIPNFQTLEVMLAERGIGYPAIRVIEESACISIPETQTPVNSRAGEWTSELGDSTGFTTLANLAANISTLDGITSALAGSVEAEQANVANQLAAQAAAMEAEAAAAAAQAAAAETAASTAATQAAAAETAAQEAAAAAASAAAQEQAAAAAAALAAAGNNT